MKSTHRLFVVSITLLFFAACQPTQKEAEPEATPAPEVSAPQSAAGDVGEEVTYEPAYPAEVSTEGLDEEDVDQQKTHDHPDGEHSHGDDGDHEH